MWVISCAGPWEAHSLMEVQAHMIILEGFLLMYSWCMLLYKLKVYNIVACNFWKLFSFIIIRKYWPYSQVLYNIILIAYFMPNGLYLLIPYPCCPSHPARNQWSEVKWQLLSRVWLCDPMGYKVHGILQTRILEWVAFPFSRGSSQPRDRTQVSCIGGGFFTSWATREAQEYQKG